jgi:hypothetical protein
MCTNLSKSSIDKSVDKGGSQVLTGRVNVAATKNRTNVFLKKRKK